MKKITKILMLASIFVFISCSNQNSEESLVKKRIVQKIETDGMGMLKNLKIESVEKLNDSTYKGVHSFTNPMFDNEVRLTRNYIFTSNLDSITKMEGKKTEMKSEGEWVETGF